jgi:hypothetical protein
MACISLVDGEKIREDSQQPSPLGVDFSRFRKTETSPGRDCLEDIPIYVGGGLRGSPIKGISRLIFIGNNKNEKPMKFPLLLR